MNIRVHHSGKLPIFAGIVTIIGGLSGYGLPDLLGTESPWAMVALGVLFVAAGLLMEFAPPLVEYTFGEEEE